MPARQAAACPGEPTLKRRVLLALASLVAIAFVDALRPPSEQIATRVALAGIHAYQEHLRSPGVNVGVRCRFVPTCSRFGEAVVRRDGAWIGGAKAAWRILRCGPWTKPGTSDPP